jgi:hypothetical protein
MEKKRILYTTLPFLSSMICSRADATGGVTPANTVILITLTLNVPSRERFDIYYK